DAFMQILPKRFILLDRRRVEYTVLAVRHPDGLHSLEPPLLEFPVDLIDILKNQSVLLLNSFFLENRSNPARKLFGCQMRFAEHDDESTCGILFDDFGNPARRA